MENNKVCNKYQDENSSNYLIEYRGNFKEQIDKVDYACGDIIDERLGIISVNDEYLERLRKDVPAIKFIEYRSVHVLQDIAVNDTDKIHEIKSNQYLRLNGRGVLVGMVDSGIDYLNNEFIREDGTSRILSIWDQTATTKNNDHNVHTGATYTNEEINNAINAFKRGEDPYLIVPQKDEVYHGTRMAGIVGGRGYNKEIEGVANDCDFVVVKLLESNSFKKMLAENGILNTPVYNNSEVLTAINYLQKYALKVNRPMVIYIGVGSTRGNHSGTNMISVFITKIAERKGMVMVAGVGNEGDTEGHASGILNEIGEIGVMELFIPREINLLSFQIWVRRPDIMSVNITTPYGESSGFIYPKTMRIANIRFVLIDTILELRYNIPEAYTGDELITLKFNKMKPGIWKIEIKSDYLVNGRYDAWLPQAKLLPEGTRFLSSDPFTTLTIPSTSRKAITVAYFDQEKNSLVSASGNGYNSNGLINPDIITSGINVLTTSQSGAVIKSSGSSVATAIVAGCCALMLQWGIVDKNDIAMFSIKIRSYLLYGADRSRKDNYPNRSTGYGNLDILKTFNIIGAIYRSDIALEEDFIEYYVGNLYVRIPKGI